MALSSNQTRYLVTRRCHFEEPCDAYFVSRAFLRDEDSAFLFLFGCPILRAFCEGWGSFTLSLRRARAQQRAGSEVVRTRISSGHGFSRAESPVL